MTKGRDREGKRKEKEQDKKEEKKKEEIHVSFKFVLLFLIT